MSPAELFMRRPLRTQLRPSVQNRVQARQADQKRLHDAHSKFREFDVGLVRNLRMVRSGFRVLCWNRLVLCRIVGSSIRPSLVLSHRSSSSTQSVVPETELLWPDDDVSVPQTPLSDTFPNQSVPVPIVSEQPTAVLPNSLIKSR